MNNRLVLLAFCSLNALELYVYIHKYMFVKRVHHEMNYVIFGEINEIALVHVG